MVIEFLDGSGTLQRVVTAYSKSLQKLGVTLDYRVMDPALFQKRVDAFDYDMITIGFAGSRTPGTELMERYSSKTLNVLGSDNAMGVHDPAVDALLERVLAAKTRPQLVSAVKSLDRVLRFGYYTVPHWYSGIHRVAWRRGRYEQPAVMPLYYQPETWATMTWWGASANRQALVSSAEKP
jgi:microcin C transport system substrate-binding protein